MNTSRYMTLWLLVSLVVVSCLWVGCSQQPSAAQAVAQETGDADQDQYFKVPGDYAGSHILVAYMGADRAQPNVTRSKEEAAEKASQLGKRLQTEPELFEEIARLESDGPSAPGGGSLGSWQKGQMVPAFEVAIDQLKDGGITLEPIETQFGYHIIRRDPIMVKHYGGLVFVIGAAGTQQVPPTVTRTMDEAKALAAEISAKINSDNFEALASEHNDFDDKPSFFAAGYPGGIPVELFNGVRGLKIGEVGKPVELPVGMAIIKRVHLEQRAGAHILISYTGSAAQNQVTRTKEEALARAKELIGQIQADPSTFDELARTNSEGPSKVSAGDLGVWFKGQMVPEFDEAITNLKEGDVTGEPVETVFGYHIIKRKAVK